MWARKFLAKQDKMEDDDHEETYVQKKLWHVDNITLLTEIDRAHRAGFGYVVHKELLETGRLWTMKGVNNHQHYGFTTPPSIGDEADTTCTSRFSEQHIEQMTKNGDLEYKGRVEVLNLIESKQVRYIIPKGQKQKDFPVGCVLFPLLGQEAEKQHVDEDIKADFHNIVDFHIGDVKPEVVAPAPAAPKKRQRRVRQHARVNTHMLPPAMYCRQQPNDADSQSDADGDRSSDDAGEDRS